LTELCIFGRQLARRVCIGHSTARNPSRGTLVASAEKI